MGCGWLYPAAPGLAGVFITEQIPRQFIIALAAQLIALAAEYRHRRNINICD